MVEIEGVASKPRAPYHFMCVPRIGERVTLQSDGGSWLEFRVIDVLHVPDGLETAAHAVRPSGVLLKVRPLG